MNDAHDNALTDAEALRKHTARVFITHNNGLDYSKAASYGTLINVTEGRFDVWRPTEAFKQVKEKLNDFDPDKDYLLVSGNALSCGLACAFLAVYAKPSNGNDDVYIKFLLFDSKKGEYFIRTVAV